MYVSFFTDRVRVTDIYIFSRTHGYMYIFFSRVGLGLGLRTARVRVRVRVTERIGYLLRRYLYYIILLRIFMYFFFTHG